MLRCGVRRERQTRARRRCRKRWEGPSEVGEISGEFKANDLLHPPPGAPSRATSMTPPASLAMCREKPEVPTKTGYGSCAEIPTKTGYGPCAYPQETAGGSPPPLPPLAGCLKLQMARWGKRLGRTTAGWWQRFGHWIMMCRRYCRCQALFVCFSIAEPPEFRQWLLRLLIVCLMLPCPLQHRPWHIHRPRTNVSEHVEHPGVLRGQVHGVPDEVAKASRPKASEDTGHWRHLARP